MRVKELEDQGGRRTHALVFAAGEDILEPLLDFARRHDLQSAYFTGIGALQDVTLGYWEPEHLDYHRIPIAEQVEVLSLAGNIALGPDGDRKVHAHIVVGKCDGTAHGGHLLAGHVRPTLELILVESPRHLRRTIDPATRLPLLDPDR